MPSDRNDPRNEDPGELISGVIQDARELAVAEVDKIRAEAKKVGETAKLAGIGLGILIVATIFLGQALGFALVALGLPDWAAFGILALITGIAAYVFIKYPRDVAKAT
jgi:putative superfamily III holin-X